MYVEEILMWERAKQQNQYPKEFEQAGANLIRGHLTEVPARSWAGF